MIVFFFFFTFYFILKGILVWVYFVMFRTHKFTKQQILPEVTDESWSKAIKLFKSFHKLGAVQG